MTRKRYVVHPVVDRWACLIPLLLTMVMVLSFRGPLLAQNHIPPTDEAVIDSLLSLGDTLLTPPTNMIVFNPGGIAADYITLGYYHALNQWNGVGAIAGYTYRPLADATIVGEFAGLSWRHYPGAQALWRFHYESMISYHRFILRDSTSSASGIAPGAMVGWQWFPEGGFAAGIGFGVEYVFGGDNLDSPEMQRMFGFRPLVAFNIGYAWGSRQQSER